MLPKNFNVIGKPKSLELASFLRKGLNYMCGSYYWNTFKKAPYRDKFQVW